MGKKYRVYKDIVTMEKTIPNNADINTELIKDCIALSCSFHRNLKYMLIIDAILSKMEPDSYIFKGSYEKVSKELGIAYSTVVRTFTSLLEHGIIERLGGGVYRVDAALIKAPVNMLRVKYVKEGDTE